jgi:ATP-binding cassette, subfamily B, bacterial PglK
MLQRLRVVIDELKIVAGRSLFRKIPWLAAMILACSLIELLSVSLVAPFVALLLGATESLPRKLLALLGADPLRNLGLLLVLVFSFKIAATFWLQRTLARTTESIRAEVMSKLMYAYQYMPYRFHLRHSTNDLIGRIVWYTSAFSTGFLSAMFRICADGLVFLALSLLILWTSPLAFGLLALVLAVTFVLVIRYTRPRTADATRQSVLSATAINENVQQAIHGLREMRVLGCEDYFRARMQVHAQKMVDVAASLSILSQIPRQMVEWSLIVFLVLLVIIGRSFDQTGNSLLPVLGLLGAAAVRLMPASTALLGSLAQIRGNRFVLGILARDLREEVLVDASQRVPQKREEAFKKLVARNLGFAYDNDRLVLKDLNFEIHAGETIGLVGPSGAGKSTLADLLLGFLDPSTGEIEINGENARGNLRKWQSMVAYIPQQAFLIDDSLRRNVALGVADQLIDDVRVLRALEDAQLGPLFADLAQGLDTRLGERGVRFSGGQRQRVSIARALYHDREFLIMDEATSALDVQTELDIVETIRALGGKKTILLIAHRESTLSVCQRRITLDAENSAASKSLSTQP